MSLLVHQASAIILSIGLRRDLYGAAMPLPSPLAFQAAQSALHTGGSGSRRRRTAQSMPQVDTCPCSLEAAKFCGPFAHFALHSVTGRRFYQSAQSYPRLIQDFFASKGTPQADSTGVIMYFEGLLNAIS